MSAGCPPPARYVFAAVASACFAIAYGANVVLSVAIVAMVNHTAIHPNASGLDAAAPPPPPCPEPPGHAHDKDGPLAWDDEVQGEVRAAYYYGYLVAQLPGAVLAERVSAKWTLWVANAVNVAGLLATPAVALHAPVAAVQTLRVFMGLGGAVTFPAMHVMIARWAPKEERGVIGGVVYAGTSLGTIGATLLGGYVSAALGWEWAFYVTGLLSAPWLLCWAWLAADHPPTDSRTDPSRRQQVDVNFPTRAILSSRPFWAILVAHFCSNCGWYMFLTELPSFMQQVLKKNMKENAGISTVPYVLMWVLSISLGGYLDSLRKKEIISTGAMRKIATGIASLIPGTCMVGISFIGCDTLAGAVIVTAAITACGGMFVGFLSNHIDLSPNFAGRLMAITNTFATIPGFLMPILIGVLTEKEETLERWSVAFYITAALYAVMFLVFTSCASGEEQPWNCPSQPSGERPPGSPLLHPSQRPPLHPPAHLDDSLDVLVPERRIHVHA